MRDNTMATLDLIAFINTTYGLSLALKTNLTGIKIDKKEQAGIIALADTLEQNLYSIKIEVEDLVNLH